MPDRNSDLPFIAHDPKMVRNPLRAKKAYPAISDITPDTLPVIFKKRRMPILLQNTQSQILPYFPKIVR